MRRKFIPGFLVLALGLAVAPARASSEVDAQIAKNVQVKTDVMALVNPSPSASWTRAQWIQYAQLERLVRVAVGDRARLASRKGAPTQSEVRATFESALTDGSRFQLSASEQQRAAELLAEWYQLEVSGRDWTQAPTHEDSTTDSSGARSRQ